MSFSLNKIFLIGNLGKDAEHRFTTNNLCVTTFSLATTRSYKGKDGNWINETTWHNIVSFNLPDFFKEQLLKGKKFHVEGRLQKRDYTDKEGIKRYVTEVVSEDLIPLDKNESSSNDFENQSTKNQQYSEPENGAGIDDDLPF